MSNMSGVAITDTATADGTWLASSVGADGAINGRDPGSPPTAPAPSTTEAATNDWGVDKIAGSDLVLALYGLICAAGVTGNLLVCLVLLRVPSFRSHTSHFLVHLAAVDLAVCLLVVPFKILPPLALRLADPSDGDGGGDGPVNVWSRLWCRLYVSQYVFWVCILASTYSLVTVNLERFLAIVYPHRYRAIFERRRSKALMLASVWLLVALSKAYIPPLYALDGGGRCRFLGWPSDALRAAAGVYTFLFNLLAPFMLMAASQWVVIARLRRQVRTLSEQTGTGTMSSKDRREMWQLRTTQRLVRTLVAFVLSFVVCWTPNSVMFLYFNLGGDFSFASPDYHCGVILAVANSCVNPVMYALTNRAFRRGLRRACLGGRACGRRPDVEDAGSVTMAGVSTVDQTANQAM